MGKQKLEPGEHGEIFLQEFEPGRWRGRTRLCLWDRSETWVSRNASSSDAARLKVQRGVTERLNAARGSEDLKLTPVSTMPTSGPSRIPRRRPPG